MARYDDKKLKPGKSYLFNNNVKFKVLNIPNSICGECLIKAGSTIKKIHWVNANLAFSNGKITEIK